MRDFTQEQTIFRESYRRFLEQEIAPHMEEWRTAGIVDRNAFRKAGEQGFLMVWPAEQYGGIGDNDFRYEQVIIEETTRAGCAEWFNTLHSRLVGPYLQHFGNEEQRHRFLPSCVSGEKILAIAMTEPDAGSDLAGMRSTLREDGDHYILKGAKTYISNGINADYVIVAAKSDPNGDPYNMTLCVVERDMEYLYNDGEFWYFMEPDTYEQHQADKAAVGDSAQWLKEQDLCEVTLYNGSPLSVSPPNFVELEIVETDPGLKGDTASGGNKPAKLSTGAVVKVPLFLSEGEIVRIDTRTGEYQGRGKA